MEGSLDAGLGLHTKSVVEPEGMVHACNPAFWNAEAGVSQVPAQLLVTEQEPVSISLKGSEYSQEM